MSNSDSNDQPSLQVIFDKLFDVWNNLENSSENSSSVAIQEKVNKSIELGQKGIDMINQLSVFSDNENIDEITTNEMKYLLLPAFLGYFTNKITSEDRMDVVLKCRQCCVNFINLCKLYSLTNYQIKSKTNDEEQGTDFPSKTPSPSVEYDSKRRQEKIERFKSVKQLENELKDLHEEVKKEHIDEEIKRDYYFKLIKKWIYESINLLESLDNEIPILVHMKKLKSSKLTENNEPVESCDGKDCHKHSKQKFKPFIIVNNNLQKSVFGLGYPSIPTVSVDEFYTQRVKEGLFPGAGTVAKKVEPDDEMEAIKREKEAEKKEKDEEIDDEDALQNARRMDEYKDNHRRGWGNRHNKG